MSVNNEPCTPEALGLLGKLYDKLDRLPAAKRAIVILVAETFINGMAAQERLGAASRAEQDGRGSA